MQRKMTGTSLLLNIVAGLLMIVFAIFCLWGFGVLVIEERYELLPPSGVRGLITTGASITEIADYLEQHHVDVNDDGDSGEVLLVFAIRNDRADVVKLLLDRGADVNGRKEPTPLYAAITGENLEIIGILLDAGADAHVQEVWPRPWTAYDWAVKLGNPDILDLIRKHDLEASQGQ